MYRPEVGEKVVYCYDKEDKWYDCFIDQEVEILSYSKVPDGNEVVTFWNGTKGLCALVFYGTEFRPLKSKRDEEIEWMASILYEEDSKEGYCSELYDAGYRKQMPHAEFVQIITDYLYDNFTDYDNAMSDAAELAAKLNRTPDEG